MSAMDILFLVLVAIAFTSFAATVAYVSQKRFRPELRSGHGTIAQDNTPQKSAA